MTDDSHSSARKEIVSKLLISSHSCLLDAITRNHAIIDEYIKFEMLIPYLNHHGIFTRYEMDYFNNKSISNTDKVNNLIEWLSKKDKSGICNFMRALSDAHEHSGHLAILKHLYDTLHPETTAAV